MIKKINIIFLLIITFSFCSSVFAKKQHEEDLFKKCLENIDLPECKEILPFKLGGGSPNEFDIFIEDHIHLFELGTIPFEW